RHLERQARQQRRGRGLRPADQAELMGAPAIVMGDKVTGQCPNHMIPNPATGAPQPSPPMPFSSPLLQGLVSSVLIGGKAAAVMGSSGYNTPPHVGLHPSDPFMVPTTE